MEEIGAWILGRIVFAIVVFQILGLATPWSPNLAPTMRLVAITATPGSIELIALIGYILLDDI